MYSRSLGMAQSTHEFVSVVSQSTSLSGNQTVAQLPAVLAQSNNAFPVGIPTNQSFPPMIQQFVPSLIQPLQHPYPISGIPPNYTAQFVCDVRRSPYGQPYIDMLISVVSDLSRKYNLERDTLDSLIQQLEFYMSPVNLPTDVYLLKQMDSLQHVPISCFSNFPKVKELLSQLTLEERTEVVTLLLKTSPMVQLNREENKVRVNRDIVVVMDTLELRGLPENVQLSEMKSLFPTSESLEFNSQDDIWVVKFKDSSEASDKFRSITNKTLKFRQQIFYVRFKTKHRHPGMDENQLGNLFYTKSSSDWNADINQPAILHQHQVSHLYQATPTSPTLAFPGQQPAQQQLAAYNIQQQQQQCLRYIISPVIFPNIMPTYILPQHPGIINIQHSHPTLSHPQALSVAPPTVALAAPSLSSPQGQAQFMHHQHHQQQAQQQQQPHHHQHHNTSIYGGNNGAIGRGNGQRRLSRGGRRGGGGGGQGQRNRLPQHIAQDDASEFKLSHSTSETASTMVHASQK